MDELGKRAGWGAKGMGGAEGGSMGGLKGVG